MVMKEPHPVPLPSGGFDHDFSEMTDEEVMEWLHDGGRGMRAPTLDDVKFVRMPSAERQVELDRLSAIPISDETKTRVREMWKELNA